MFGIGSNGVIQCKNGMRVSFILTEVSLEEQFYADTMFVRYKGTIDFSDGGVQLLGDKIDTALAIPSMEGIADLEMYGKEYECRVLSINISRPTVAVSSLCQDQPHYLPSSLVQGEIEFITTVHAYTEVEEDSVGWQFRKDDPQKKEKAQEQEINRFDLMEWDD